MTNEGLKGGFGTAMSELTSRAVTPVATYGGQALNKAGQLLQKAGKFIKR
jgi:hypothetical protein